MKPRDPHKIARIYQATLALVAEIGLAGLTMSKIGKKAKLGMGTIYTYFSSKEEIINSLYQHLKHKHGIEVYAKVEDEQPFLCKLKAIFEVYIQNSYYREAEFFFMEQCRSSLFLSPASKMLEENAFAKMNELLEEGKTQLLVKKLDNGLLISYMMGGVQGFISQLKIQELSLTPALMEEAFELCYGSIKA